MTAVTGASGDATGVPEAALDLDETYRVLSDAVEHLERSAHL